MAKKQPILDTKGDGKKSGRSRPQKIQEFIAFAEWMALPEPLQEYKTQGEFAKAHKVAQQTLSEWKDRKDFWALVEGHRQEWGQEKTANVLAKLYAQLMQAKSINVEAYRLWLELFTGHIQRIRIEGGIGVTIHNPLENMSDTELDAYIERRSKVLRATRTPLALPDGAEGSCEVVPCPSE